jgi:hypothetical protein
VNELWREITYRTHRVINRLAWRYARPEGPELGIATRIDKTRLLWRLNDWLASQWLPEWIKKSGTIRG